jgi:protoheme IX farnesyltransferase
MRISTQTLRPSRVAADAAGLRDYLELTKPRLSLMAVATAVLGYFAAGPRHDPPLFAALVLGTTLAAFAAATLNQWWERAADARMARTADRPLPAGRMRPATALVFGLALAVAGVAVLLARVNPAAALLAAATILLYVGAYTPLKRVTPRAIELGAVPGALPPLIGWFAAGAGWSGLGWTLFAVLFAWQIPHFMAIAWLCRDDYRRAGFRIAGADAGADRSLAARALLWTLLLAAISLLPLRDPQTGWLLAAAAVLGAAAMLIPAWRWWRGAANEATARRLFRATLIYLPLYLGALVVDRFVI